jgi:hypothetical protein
VLSKELKIDSASKMKPLLLLSDIAWSDSFRFVYLAAVFSFRFAVSGLKGVGIS